MLKDKHNPLRFAVIFIVLFVCFYYFNIMYLGLTSPGNHYIAFLADHLNYIQWLRTLLLLCSKQVLVWMGYTTITNNLDLLVAGHYIIELAYSCLGFGVMSFLGAFTIAYPNPVKQKIIFFIAGVLIFQLLNIARFIVLALYWKPQNNHIIDHHTIFNILIYLIITISVYFWIKNDVTVPKTNETNRSFKL
jgi:exosortase/archaeosortase family protein